MQEHNCLISPLCLQPSSIVQMDFHNLKYKTGLLLFDLAEKNSMVFLVDVVTVHMSFL